jgi:hypothetical protein
VETADLFQAGPAIVIVEVNVLLVGGLGCCAPTGRRRYDGSERRRANKLLALRAAADLL